MQPELIKNAKAAIQKILDDDSVPDEVIVESLNEIMADIQMLIDTLSGNQPE